MFNLIKIQQNIILLSIFIFSYTFNCLEFDDGLVSYYPLKGSVDDDFGSNNGSQNGAISSTNRHSENSSAYKFNGSGYLTIPESVLNSETEFSITMWVKKENDMTNNFALISGTLSGNKDFAVLGDGFYFSNTLYSTNTLKDNMTLNQWNHIGIIVRNGSYKQFVDGKIVYTKTNKPAYTANFGSGGLIIGQLQSALGGGFDINKGFKGIISDIRIYGEAIPIYNIYEIYHFENDNGCSFTCSSCDANNQCISCKGDRILQDGKCLCPYGLQDDKKSVNCYNYDINSDSQLLNYLPLKSSAYDVINNHANVEHFPILDSNRFGETSSALKFGGLKPRLNLPSVQAKLQGKKQFSLSTWIKQSGNLVNHVFFHLTTAGENRLIFYLGHVNLNDISTNFTEIKDELIMDEWIHITYVLDISEIRIYKNGCLYFKGPNSQLNIAFNIHLNGCVVGQEQDALDGGFDPNDDFKGSLSDFRIYNGALSDDKIRLIYEKERVNCPFSCELCEFRSSLCAVCRGDRLYHEGRCLCQNGKIDDFKSENCVDKDTTINEDLIAYYPMQNNGLDVVHRNDAIVKSLTPTTNRFDWPNTAYTYANSSTMLTIPHGIFQGLREVSFSIWALNTKTDVENLYGFIFTGASSLKDNIIHISYKHSPFYYNDNSTPSSNNYNLHRKMVIGEWYHLVFVCGTTNFEVYVDGQLMFQGSKLDRGYPIENNGFHVGQDQDSLGGNFDTNQAWKGKLSDLRIYGKSLTPEDVTLIDLVDKFPCDRSCDYCHYRSRNCHICLPNSSVDTDLTICVCDDGFYRDSTTFQCLACEYQCATCQNQASECITCSDSNRGISNNPKCSCNDGYFEQGSQNPVCGQCTDRCTTCVTSADNCLICAGSNRKQDGPTCSCQTGYYDIGIINCQQCNTSKCETCETNADNCLLCANPNQNNKDPNNNCECLNGFFGSECGSACDSACLTCETTASNCTSCLGNKRELNTCDCELGYYDNGVDDDCQQCTIPNCVQCDPSAPSECLIPEDKHYLDDNKIPQECPYSCAQCTALDTCTECIPSNRDTPSCDCIEGYFENDQQVCKQCQGICQSCSNSTSCNLCNNPNQNNKDPNNNCECLNGFFGSDCGSACDSACLTCETSASNCTSCQGSNRELNTCDCEQGYYDNGVDDNCQQCTIPNCVQCDPLNPTECLIPEDRHYLDDNKIPQECPYSCTSCTAFNNCQQCIPSNRDTPSCDCTEGYFENDQQACEQCQGICQSCSNSNSCNLCNNPNQNNKDPNNNCECLNGFFGSECGSACDSACLTCETTASNCTSCLGNNRELNTCDCEQGYYDNGVDDDCQQCTIPNCVQCDPSTPGECLIPEDKHYLDDNQIPQECPYSCAQCTAFDVCTQCIPSNRDTPSCDCTEGYFENDQQVCEQCQGICQSCSNSSSCTLCNNPNQNNKNPNNNCECLNGFFGSDCGSTCDTTCLTCETTASNCTSCLGNNRELNTCDCEQGYYDNGVDDNCQQCTIPNCIQCDPSAPNQCLIPEDRHYLDENKIPQQCPEFCKSCQNSQLCTECDLTSPLRLVNELCICPKGYYSNSDNGQCSQCQEECAECENGNECTIVKNCQRQCKSCMKTAQQCIQCSGLNREPVPSCQCLPGYYDDQVSNHCQACSPLCAECDNSFKCTKCAFQGMRLPYCLFFKQFTSFFTVTDSDTGEKIEENCSPKCQNCETTKDNCLTCSIGQNRLPIEQNCECLQGYYDMNSTEIDCQQCPLYCLNCDTYGQCLKCDTNINRVLDEFSLECKCKTGFKETAMKECQRCYLYSNECVFECPENTNLNKKKGICVDIVYKEQNNMLLIFVCGFILLVALFTTVFISKLKIVKPQINLQKNSQLQQIQEKEQDEIQQNQQEVDL